MRAHRLVLAVAGALSVAFPAFPADYWVRGEATVQGNPIPPACPQVGTRFSAVVHVNNAATCNAHATCTSAKVQAVNNWIGQLNQRNLGQCAQYVQQEQSPCTYHC